MTKDKKKKSPVKTLLVLTLCAIILLVAVLWLSLPYMKAKDEDPDALPERHAAAVELTIPTQETIL